MKKTIFIGISMLAISICIDEVRGREPIRRNSSSAVMIAGTSSYPQKQEANTQVLIPGNNGRPRDVLSSIVLEETTLTQLKNIINSVPSKNIRALKKNIGDLYDKLPKNSDKDVQTAVDIMNRALSCLEELLNIRNNLYFELFNKSEERENLPDSVELAGIIESLNHVDMEKLVRVISICEKECEREKSLIAFTENLKKFSNRIKESRKILEEMQQKLSPIMLSQIEGSVGLKNLETTNTPQNQRLGERRDSGYSEEQQNTDQTVTGDNSNNAPISQSTQGQQQDTESIHILPGPFVQEPEDIGQQETQNISVSNNAPSSSTTSAQQNVGQTGTAGDNLNNAPSSQVTPAQQNAGQTDGGSNINAASPVSATQQNVGQQSVAGGDSNNTISQPNSLTGNQPTQSTSGQSTVVENNSNNTLSQSNSGTEGNIAPQPIPGQQPGTENNSGNAAQQSNSGTESNTGGSVSSSTPAQSGQSGTVEGSNLNAVSPISATQQNVGQSVTASSSEVNIINKESPEKFYALLETNIKSLKDEDLRDEKKKAAYDKVCKYLEEAKNSQRSFEQRVSDVLHIINTYNSLATLVPKTKEGKRLSTVPRQKIKSLREVIYSEVFDDMKLRMEKLKSDDRFKKFTADFDEFIKNNDDNKTYFEKSTSGRDKRKYMSASAKAYAGLIEKIWEELNVNYETVDRIGYTLVKVINSIDVN